jgi:hypothetical protein
MAEVFVTNRTNVHLSPTPDNPEGAVVVLQPGINDVPDVVAADPFIMTLVRTSAPLVELAKAEADALKAQEEAAAQQLQVVAEAQKTKLDALMAAGEEWATKKQAAMDAGTPFDEPHPDPNQNAALALTGPPHVFAGAALIGLTAPIQPGGGVTPRVLPDLSGDSGTTTTAGATGP